MSHGVTIVAHVTLLYTYHIYGHSVDMLSHVATIVTHGNDKILPDPVITPVPAS